MAPSPRAQSERLRRFFIALVMLGVLAVSTATAMWVSHLRAPEGPPKLVVEDFGWFTMPRPVKWRAREVTQDETAEHTGLTALAVFSQTGHETQHIMVYELLTPEPVPPDFALDFTFQHLPTATRQVRAPMRADGMMGLIGRGRVVGANQYVFEQFTAALTLDGRRYVLINMLCPTQRAQEHLDLLARMARGVVDQRYVAVDGPMRLPGVDQPVEIPEDVQVYRRANQPEADDVLITPAEGGAWWSLRMTPIRLDGADDFSDLLPADGISGSSPFPPEFKALFSPDIKPTIADRMLVAIAWVYWQAHGRLPTRPEWATVRHKGHDGYVAVIETRLGDRKAFAVKLSDQRAVLMDLTTSSDAVALGQVAAAKIADAMLGTPQ